MLEKCACLTVQPLIGRIGMPHTLSVSCTLNEKN
jgi:hypothetical protein